MKQSKLLLQTYRDAPRDADVVSQQMMMRAGMIQKVAAGIYDYLPLALRSIRKFETIVREELARDGAQELLMPTVQPGELWQESGRWQFYGRELLRLKDRKGADFCLGPTHEEVVTDIVRKIVKSYKQLPINVFQVQTKFRDEIRPRFGLMRGREFIMKDAYSFDVTSEKALVTYQAMYDAYSRIFRRCGLDFRTVEADSGAIGGSKNHEFQVLADSGEDLLVACDNCDYAANVEQAELADPTAPGIAGPAGALAEVSTPAKHTIEEVATFLAIEPRQLIKTLIYMADGQPVAVLLRGDRGLNEVKLKRLLDATELFLAREGQVVEATGAPTGFAGPAGLTIKVVADVELRGARGAVVGGNKKDVHLTGFDIERDATVSQYASLRMAEAGDLCPRCGTGHYRQFRGIEVGHVFYLTTVYSVPMGCTFLDEAGAEKPMEMGCYGIGITRTAAAAIEQNHDESGIVWPMSIAPYEVSVLSLQQDGARGGCPLRRPRRAAGRQVQGRRPHRHPAQDRGRRPLAEGGAGGGEVAPRPQADPGPGRSCGRGRGRDGRRGEGAPAGGGRRMTMNGFDPGNRLIAALDVEDRRQADALAAQLAGAAGWLKIGLELFIAAGPDLVRDYAAAGRRIMLDLKLHDIPATVERAVSRAAALGAELMTIHAGGGRAMIEAAAAAAHRAGAKRPRVLAVTVLTSLDERDLEEVGARGPLDELVVRRARLAAEAGADGVVASPREAALVRAAAPAGFLIVTPGVRPAGAAAGDQKRVLTAAEARAAGADLVVVGRPIRDAADPAAIARAIAAELESP
jgi:prolyl-tRNA synthetase